jgi:hypothetical protein
MDHFPGISPRERYDNDLLNEMRMIRQMLERNAQAVEQPKETKITQIQPVQRRGRKKVVNK